MQVGIEARIRKKLTLEKILFSTEYWRKNCITDKKREKEIAE